MKTKPALYLFVAALLAAPTLAGAADGTAPTQQQRMKACNAEAKSKALRGDERRTFMSACLKAHPAPAGDKQARRD